ECAPLKARAAARIRSGPKNPVDQAHGCAAEFAPVMRISKPVRIALYAVGTLVVFYLAAVGIMSTRWFNRFLLRQVITNLEDLTGARVEITRLGFHPYSLQVTLQGLILHCRQSPAERPLFSAQALVIVLNPLVVLRRKLMLRRFDLQNAEVHVRRYPDGSTNFPGPA